jgi:hypothetical protein
MAKETGKSIGDLLCDIAYDSEEKANYRLKAIEIYLGTTVTKHSHQTVEKIEGPQIMLPAMRDKPKPDGWQETAVH